MIRARDGALVRLDVSREALTVVVEGLGSVEPARASVPYPSHGYGGHELVLSAEERYLAMALWSGQSEIGYELFTLRPELRHIGGLAYVQGVGPAPVFSRDEQRLALAWATNASLNLEEHPLDDEGRTRSELVVEWARVRVQELPDGPAHTCAIHVRLPAAFPFEGDDSWHPERLEVTHDEARLHAPWGVTFCTPLPLPEVLCVEGPSARG